MGTETLFRADQPTLQMKRFFRSRRTLCNLDTIHRIGNSDAGSVMNFRKILAIGVISCLFPLSASAANLTVTNAADDGSGSLRQTMIGAAPGDVILFDAAVFTALSHTITLVSELPLNKALTIDASGPFSGVTLSGNGSTRLISVGAAGNLILKKLTLSGGNSSGSVAAGFGGAIYSAGIGHFEDCTFSNSASVHYGGAIFSSGSLEIIRCTITGNSAGSLGGGIYSASSGNLNLTNTTVTGNDAVLFGGAIYHTSPLTLTHATITANNADNKGGGIYNDFGSALTLQSSIVTGNTAPESSNFFGPFTVSPTNLTSGDPKLAPLGNYGGPTLTMPPLPDSPAIDQGDDEMLSIDQRGFPRVLAAGADIGAAEAEVGDYNPVGLTLHTRVPTGASTGVFEISTDPEFLPVVGTYAGTGFSGVVEGARSTAQFGYPSAVAKDLRGNTFVVDSGNHRIRMIDPSGNVSTIAGKGPLSGLANGPGPDAEFSFPTAVAVGPDANVYVTDTFNHRICKLVRPALVGGVWMVETLAGPSTSGNAGFQNQSGSAARFSYPYGLSLDPSGNVYVADAGNNRIRKITPAGGVSTYAGSGTAGYLNTTPLSPAPTSPIFPDSAQFNTPLDVIAVGTTLFVADTGNHCIRKITADGSLASEVTHFAGSITGVAGDADGTGAAAQFNSPSGLASSDGGILYVADELNYRIRAINTDGVVSTVAGTSTAGLVNGKSNIAQFKAPTGLMVASGGNLIVADSENHMLRRIVIKNTELTSIPNGGDLIAGQQQVSAVLDASALGLDPGESYFIRWVSTGGAIQDLGFRFVLYELPTLATEAASNRIPTSARLNATVNPKDNPTDVVFEYSTAADLLPPYGVSTLAGSIAAGLVDASGIVADGLGGAYVADRANHRILHVGAGGAVSTLAGSGVAGFNDATATSAQFESPGGLAIDGDGNVYVADEFNHRIRIITPAGVVTTFAGSGTAGFGNGPKNSALFLYPSGVAVDAAGNVFVADTGNHRIREISKVTGNVTTLAGSGVSGISLDGTADVAQFASPRGITVDSAGSNVWVADTGNQRVRLIFSGNVFSLAGDGTAGFADGNGTAAQFSSPTGIALDENGMAYVSDSGNHRIRTVKLDGTVGTLAGSGIAGTIDSPLAGNGLYPATATQFSSPSGISIDSSGRLFVTQNSRVRKISRAAELPTVSISPRANGSVEQLVSADIPQPLLPNAAYYFRAVATNYRGTVTGEMLSFVTPQAGITVFDGAAALADGQINPIDFGNTPTGQPVTRQITISNPGSYALQVASVSVPAGYLLAGGPWAINPLDTLTLDLTLQASSAGDFSGDVTISSDAAGQPTFAFPVTGVVLDPPAVITLAATAVTGTSATLNATVNPLGSSTTVWFEWSLDPEFDGLTVSTQAATLSQPSGLATDAAGNIYIADTLNHRVRKIAPNGTATTLAGTGAAGFANGPGNTAQFNEPVGIVVTANGAVYVADSKNHCIRGITPAGVVSTFSGLGPPGFTDGIPAAARFNLPSGLAIDGNGSLHVADRGNHRIRKVGPDGTVSTLAGKTTAGSTNGAVGVALFDNPIGIAVDTLGNAYVTEAASHAIRKVAPDGTTAIFAGSAALSGTTNSTGANARFTSPAGLTFRADGTLLVADKGNHLIRSVSPTGEVAPLVGSGTAGIGDGLGEVAQFDQPISLATTAAGDVVVGEMTHAPLRKITSTQVLVQAATDLTGTVVLPVDTSLTDLTAGASYYFRAIATNGSGTTIGGFLTFGGEPFLAWQSLKFGPDANNPAIAGATADPAQDGICNLLKYAFFMEPSVFGISGLPVEGNEPGELSLIFTKVHSASDLLYVPEWSTNLVNWFPTGITEEIMSDNGTTQQVCASIPTTPGGALFLRINVTLQQP
jgi:sugar lactone lactonase YvrE